jgi:hypothetical protein
MGAPGTWSRNNCPYPWDPKKAITFFDAINLIDVYLDPKRIPRSALSREMVALFFFHETAFSNIRQKIKKENSTETGPGPGVGFGQIEIQNSDKPLFLRKVFGIKPDDGLFGAITEDEHFAIQLHVAYLINLYDNGARTREALVTGQAGTANAVLKKGFLDAEPLLQSAIYSSNRLAIIDALNTCRWYIKRDLVTGKPILDPDTKIALTERKRIPYNAQYKAYWDFTLPESELVLGIRV